MNILFTSAGRRVSLIQSFKQALFDLGLSGKVVIADMKKDAPSIFVGDEYELVPSVSNPNYIETLKNICIKHRIQLLVPLIDTELYLLSISKIEFESIGVTVLVSSPEVNEICFDKRKTAAFFKNLKVDSPQIFKPENILSNPEAHYPFFLKPVSGSCSIGATKINNARELEFFLEYTRDAIIQEYITGEEYTLDVLVGFDNNVRAVVPRLRLETRAGEISKGVTCKSPELINAGKRVVTALPGAIGCITVQCFFSSPDKITFIEINPRFGGGIPLSIKAGADFPRWIILMMLNRESEIDFDEWKSGVVMLRYDDAIFVNKDDIK